MSCNVKFHCRALRWCHGPNSANDQHDHPVLQHPSHERSLLKAQRAPESGWTDKRDLPKGERDHIQYDDFYRTPVCAE